ncbi:MAG: hypothetical protein FWG39_03510 [Alphaproteobacteria bacterium]|nr:hypothetical protein [Alphaproteobacteria bacterium]
MATITNQQWAKELVKEFPDAGVSVDKIMDWLFANNSREEIREYVSGQNEIEEVNPFEKAKAPGKNLKEWLQEKAKHVQNTTIGKLTSRHNRHKYEEKDASTIVGAIFAAGIDPTKGLDDIVTNASKIMGKIKKKDKEARAKFQWMIETFTYMKNSKLKVAFNDALKSGARMNYMVEQMAEYAAGTGAIEECKAAMEMLAVIRYELFSSQHYDEFAKNEWDFVPPSVMNNAALKPIGVMFKTGTNLLLKAGYKGLVAGRNVARGAMGNAFTKAKEKVKSMTGGESGGKPSKQEELDRLKDWLDRIGEKGKGKASSDEADKIIEEYRAAYPGDNLSNEDRLGFPDNIAYLRDNKITCRIDTLQEETDRETAAPAGYDGLMDFWKKVNGWGASNWVPFYNQNKTK